MISNFLHFAVAIAVSLHGECDDDWYDWETCSKKDETKRHSLVMFFLRSIRESLLQTKLLSLSSNIAFDI